MHTFSMEERAQPVVMPETPAAGGLPGCVFVPPRDRWVPRLLATDSPC